MNKMNTLNLEEFMSVPAKLKKKDHTLLANEILKHEWMNLVTSKMTSFFKSMSKNKATNNGEPKTSSGKQRIVVCNGVFLDYRKGKKPYNFGMLLSTFEHYCAVLSNSDYKMGMSDSHHQVFAHECNHGEAAVCGIKLPSHFICIACFNLFKDKPHKRKSIQTIQDSPTKIMAVEIACNTKIDLTPLDHSN